MTLGKNTPFLQVRDFVIKNLWDHKGPGLHSPVESRICVGGSLNSSDVVLRDLSLLGACVERSVGGGGKTTEGQECLQTRRAQMVTPEPATAS